MMATDICEWCDMEYPCGSYDYYEMEVWRDRAWKTHLICADCYEQLKKKYEG